MKQHFKDDEQVSRRRLEAHGKGWRCPGCFSKSLWIFTLFMATGTVVACGGDLGPRRATPSCSSDSDCNGDEYCNSDSQCKLGCRRIPSDNCPGGEICNEEHNCVTAPAPGTEGLTSSLYSLSDGPPGIQPLLACDWDWSAHYLYGVGSQEVPRPKYFSSCINTETNKTELYVSFSIGESWPGGQNNGAPDPTAGMMLRAELNAEGKFEVSGARHFPECRQMEGVTTSADCSTVAAICRVPPGSEMKADIDAREDQDPYIAPPNEAPNPTSQLWLYEWRDHKWQEAGAEPLRVVVHKRVRGAARAQLRHGQAAGTYGISTSAKTGYYAKHSNHALVVVKRDTVSGGFEKVDAAGWDDLCGGVHAGYLHRMVYDPDGQNYAAVCAADHKKSSLNFRMGDGIQPKMKYSFHRHEARSQQMGGPGPVVHVPGGGFLVSVVGMEEERSPDDPMAIGVARVAGDGRPLDRETGLPINIGDTKAVSNVVKWLVVNPDNHLAHPQLAYLGQVDGQHRYLLGWSVMRRLNEPVPRDDDLRFPFSYHVMEIDAQGNPIPDTKREIFNAGWGDLDQMVSLGQGRVAWVHTTESTLTPPFDGKTNPPCNVNKLQFNVYTSVSFRGSPSPGGG